MIESALFLGFCSALGVFIVLLRMPRMFVLHVLGRAWLLDVIMSAIMFAMHWGTAVGGFSAVIASLFCSAGITLCKGCLGHITAKHYYSGWFGDTRPLGSRQLPSSPHRKTSPL